MSDNQKPKILMVDDEPDFQMIARSWIEGDYEFHCAGSEEAFASALLTFVPDLVMLDLYMPGAGGFELCRRLHAKPGLEKVPVLFLTGSVRIEDFQENMAAGGAAYLTKPISRPQLLKTIAELLPQPVMQEDGSGD